MNSVSIGYFREDGDFAILATLNNNDGYLLSNEFNDLVKLIKISLSNKIKNIDIVALNREDAPDYVGV